VIADAREQAERWCSALWGDREGWALTAVGRSPQMSSAASGTTASTTSPTGGLTTGIGC